MLRTFLGSVQSRSGSHTSLVCRAGPHSTAEEGQAPRRRRRHTSSNKSRKTIKESTIDTGRAAAGQQAISRVQGKESSVLLSQHEASAPPPAAAAAAAAAADIAAGPTVQQPDRFLAEAGNAPAQLAATSEQQVRVADENAAAEPSSPLPPAAAAAAAEVPPLSERVPLPARGEPQYPDAPFKLRPYQAEAIHKVIQEWKAGVNVQMVMLPTGCGKTVVFAALARYLAQHYVPPTGALGTAAVAEQSDADQPLAASAPSPPLTAAAAAGGVDSSSHAGSRGHRTVAVAASSAGDYASLQPQAEGTSEAASSSVSEADSSVALGDSSDDDAEDLVEKGSPIWKLQQLGHALGDTGKSLPWQTLDPRPAARPCGSNIDSGSSSSSSAVISYEDGGTQEPSMGSWASDTGDDEGSGSDSDDDGLHIRSALLRQHMRDLLDVTEEQEALLTSPSALTASRASSSTATATLDRSAGSSSDALSTSDDTSSSSRGRGRPKGTSRSSQAAAEPEVVCAPGAMRVLVLAHRYELLRQAEEKFTLMWGAGFDELSVSWLKGRRKEFGGQLVVASVATAVNCIEALRACNFSLVIVDEAHHSVASTYTAILEGLGFIEEVPAGELADAAPEQPTTQHSSASPAESDGSSSSSGSGSCLQARDSLHSLDEAGEGEAEGVLGSTTDSGSFSDKGEEPKAVMRAKPNPHQLLLGFTATPYRMKKAESSELYSIFPTTYVRTIPEMIRAGHLSEVGNQKVLTQTDLKGALVSPKGDFNLKKLSALVNSHDRNKLVLGAYLEHCTEPTADGGEAYSELQREQHARIALDRAMKVKAALDNRVRKAAEKRAAMSSSAAEDEEDEKGKEGKESEESEEGEEGEADEEGEEEEKVAQYIYPLPDNEQAELLDAGFSMSGRRAARKTIGFAVDIWHAEALNAVFNAAGVRASAIHSLMPHDLVCAELTRFRKGDLDVLFNVEVLTEGFDEPSIDAILMARPTRSPGLYTQMLGRGLRIMPGKKDCQVLDFTDKYHQAGKVVDARVLLPDLSFKRQGGYQVESKKGPSKIETEAGGGETQVLESSLDPQDLAWKTIGRHCMTSIFSGGNVWLVNVADMGPSQRKALGIVAAAEQQPDTGSRRQQQQHQQPDAAEDVDEDGDDSMSMQEDRFVVLHQKNSKDADPSTWDVAFTYGGHSWKGLTKEDAYGTALDYLEQFVHMQLVKAANRVGTGRFRAKQWAGKEGGSTVLNQFKQDAPWRRDPASDRQKAQLKKMGIELPAKRLTKGEASDLISKTFSGLASPQQVQQLQERLGPQAFADLPVPLLQAHAATLLKTG